MTERKTYYLDLSTLLTLLRNKSGTLSCKIKLHGQWGNGLITLKRGQIGQSIVEWSQGRLEGKEAFEHLSSVQEWQVNFDGVPSSMNISPATFSSLGVHPLSPTPPSYAPTSPMGMSPPAPMIPRVRNPLNSFVLAHYTSEQRLILRTVYELVDGQKTIDQIKVQVNAHIDVPAETVDVALATLQHLGTIF